jgi:polysaccharide biosynthesis/export protein
MISLSRRAARAFGPFVLAGLAAAATGCSSAGSYVWYSEVSPDQMAAPKELVIHVGDTVSLRVLGHDEMTIKERVRSDGRIAVPLIGEIDAQGKRPSSLRSELEGRLKDYIVSPSVMLNVDEVQPITVVLLGEVGKQGAYLLDPYTGLAQALAVCGGLTEFAHKDRIFIVREQPRPMRIRFTYEAVSRDEGHAASFPLRNGDVVVAE